MTTTNVPIPSNQPPLSPLRQLLQEQLRQHEPQLILAILPETGVLRHETFSNEADLHRRLRELLDSEEEVSVSISVGFRLLISKPPLRYIVTPWGRTPLFEPLVDELSVEEDGFLGRRYDDLLPPAEEPDEDEEEEEDAADQHDEDEDDTPTVDEAPDIFTQRRDGDEEDDDA